MAVITNEFPRTQFDEEAFFQRLDAKAVSRLRTAYTTRFVDAALREAPEEFSIVKAPGMVPQAGDVVIARVVELGKHTKLQSVHSRRQRMFPGQQIMVAYGNRYAPDQFLAHVPQDLGPCQLAAGGGLASSVEEQHDSIDQATQIAPLGLLMRNNQVVNLSDYAPLSIEKLSAQATAAQGSVRPPVIAVLGTSMNSGKTTTLACLVNGLTNAGLDVAAGKATGTGAGNDPDLFEDAGAVSVRDFTDFGYPTTYRLEYETIRQMLVSMIQEQSATGAQVVVIEIADGLFQGETGRLLNDPIFNQYVDRVLFSAQDALGAVAGEQILLNAGLDLAAVSGILTASPLSLREARGQLRTQVISTYDLCEADTALSLLPQA